MEEEFKNLLLKLESVVNDVERVERRIDKLQELTERAKAEGRETVGYDLAMEEYQNQISMIVDGIKGDFKSLEEYEAEMESQKDDLDKERLKKMAMCEVEKALNEDPVKVSELENEIRGIEDKIKGLDEVLGKIRLIKEKLQPYMPKPPSECSHSRKRPLETRFDVRGTAVLYECPDCGKRWWER
jgi:DNA repair exonuclease SbcCD ATPase subunit